MVMAVGVVPNVHQLDLVRMSQQQLEAEAMNFELLGLIVLSNPVRPDSKTTMTRLQDRWAGLILLRTHMWQAGVWMVVN